MGELDFLENLFRRENWVWLFKVTFFLLGFFYAVISLLFFRQVAMLERFLKTGLGRTWRFLSLTALLVSLLLSLGVWLI